MSELRQAFIEGMSRAAASVNVVTTDGPAGRFGLTVSAMTPVSADGAAPSLLVCLNEASAALEPLRANGCFSVNVLRLDQQAISDVFSGRVAEPSGGRFEGIAVEAGPSGAPRLLEALVSFDCTLVSSQKLGTHHICIGAVQDVHMTAEGEPLLYGMRSYLRAEKH